ncbi:MAG: GMC oxidoreductase, partial [Gemmatimonadaceae bacterium]|nr:GMC oxidoreductase [Gemmatimonadaceae bacterium]
NAVLGTHRTRLPVAEAAGVHVVAMTEVVAVAPQRVIVRAASPAAASAWGAGEVVLTAACIVLAAGTLHTSGLLLRAGLGRALRMLGRGVTCHPTHVIVAEHPRAITNDVGHPTAYRVDRTSDEGYLLEPCFSSPLVTARNLTGFGPEHAQVLAAYPRLQMLRVTARDRARAANRVALDRDGRPVLRYALSTPVRDALVRGQRAAARIAFGAGAVRVHVPAADPPRLERRDISGLAQRIALAHELPGRVSLSATQPLGGAAMSADARTGVTDARGRVHGAPWLRVADGSLCPDSPGVHPALLIMALAERVAETVAEELPALGATAPAVA